MSGVQLPALERLAGIAAEAPQAAAAAPRQATAVTATILRRARDMAGRAYAKTPMENASGARVAPRDGAYRGGGATSTGSPPRCQCASGDGGVSRRYHTASSA